MTSQMKGSGSGYDGGSRLATKEQSHLTILSSDSREFTTALKQLCQIFDSCFGTSGLAKAIHNNSGGHVVMTSQCYRMLQTLQFSRPIVRLVAAALQSHVTNYMDQGLFAGRLGLHLIKAASDLNIHKHLIMEIFNKLLKLSMDYLQSKDCNLKIDFSTNSKEKLSEMICLVKSVIGTKPLCGLSETDLHHISMLSVETFINSSDHNSFGVGSNVHYIQLEGYTPSESRLLNGLLFQTPSIPTYASSAIKDMIRVPGGDNKRDRIRTVLVSVSLAGDSEEFMNTVEQWEDGEGLDIISIEEAMVEKLLEFGENLVKQQVGLLACQKVVHPQLRQYLEANQVVVLDRLGSTHTTLFNKLTGGEQVRSIMTNSIPENTFGYVDSIDHCVYNSKSYLHLQADNSSIVTVLLANRSEEALAELKGVFEASLCVLGHCEREPFYLPGGGCWQSVLASHVYSQANEELLKWSTEFDVSKHIIQPIITCFTSCLLQVGLPLVEPGFIHTIDTSYSHHWYLPSSIQPDELSCSCGSYQHTTDLKFNEIFSFDQSVFRNVQQNVPGSNRDTIKTCSVIDCFSAAKSALQCGVSIASMIIGIANVITDTN